MSGTLLGKLRVVSGVGLTWSRWVQVWEQRSGRRIIERLRKDWLFDSRFEQLEPRQMRWGLTQFSVFGFVIDLTRIRNLGLTPSTP